MQFSPKGKSSEYSNVPKVQFLSPSGQLSVHSPLAQLTLCEQALATLTALLPGIIKFFR